MTEIDYANKNLCSVIANREVLRRGWKMVKTPWTNISKGSSDQPSWRAKRQFQKGSLCLVERVPESQM